MHRETFQDIETEAIQWLVRLDKGSTPELSAELDAWMARSTRHRVAYAKHQLAWKRMDVLRRARPLEHLSTEADPNLLKRRASWFGLSAAVTALAATVWTPKTLAAIAAAAMVVVIAAVTLPPSGGVEYTTRIGEQRTVTLDDGTQLTLNTNSKVRVRFTPERRRIFLDRGEVMLAVAHDESRALEVVAGDVTSRAVGTKFSVRVREDDSCVETLVTEGRVLVLRQSHLLGIPLAKQSVTRTLDAGEKLIVGSSGAELRRVTAKQVSRELMWMSGRIELDGDPLTDVVREVNRYNSRKLVILDPAISRRAVGGAFLTSDADNYARHLIRHFGAKKLGAEAAAR